MIRRRSKPRRRRPELNGGHCETLRGAAKQSRRWALFERSGGRCEEMLQFTRYACLPGSLELARAAGTMFIRCNATITWESMEWSHKRHGIHRCDCMECGIASCRACHARRHNPKSVPRKQALS